MFCENCGKEILDNDNFCTNCGAPLNENAKTSQPFKSNNINAQPRELSFWQRFQLMFLKFRSFCCYACSISTIGTLILIIGCLIGEPAPVMIISLFLLLLGNLFAFFACPMILFGTMVKIIYKCAMIGIWVLVFGFLIGALVGSFLSAILMITGPCFITIPYCQKVLREKIKDY